MTYQAKMSSQGTYMPYETPTLYPAACPLQKVPTQGKSNISMPPQPSPLKAALVEFWGLPPLILFFNMSIGWFGRFALSTECYRTRKFGYKDLNWPRCSARVT